MLISASDFVKAEKESHGPAPTEEEKKPATTSAGAASRSCSVCGKKFIPVRATSKCCSKACLDKSYRLYKKEKTTSARVKPPMVASRKPSSAATGTKVCVDCRKAYKPSGNRQERCEDCGKKHRLGVIRKLAQKNSRPMVVESHGPGPNLDDIPEFQRAQAEARDL